jgi:hypothetical protein
MEYFGYLGNEPKAQMREPALIGEGAREPATQLQGE